MAARSESGVHRLHEGRTDIEYALAAGLYIAFFLSSVVGLGLSVLDPSAAGSYLGFLCILAFLAAVVGKSTTRNPELAVVIGRRDASWLLAVLPAGWPLGAFGFIAIGVEPPGVVVALSVLTAGVGGLLGVLLVAMSRTRYAAAVLAGVDEHAQWEARWPRRWRRAAISVIVVSSGIGVFGVVADVVLGVEWGSNLFPFVFAISLFSGVFNPRTVRVTDAGLVVEYPVARHCRPWSAVEKYRLTDGALVVRWNGWWRPALRCDRADIENVETAVGALDSGPSS